MESNRILLERTSKTRRIVFYQINSGFGPITVLEFARVEVKAACARSLDLLIACPFASSAHYRTGLCNSNHMIAIPVFL